jgi:uncharacterized protein with von Willebrand factor type A (vWA) domain
MKLKTTLHCTQFELDAENSFVQLEVTMSFTEYNELLGKSNDFNPSIANKGRALIQCLDCSGSMSGEPMKAQKAGISHLGDIIFAEKVSLFEHYVTLAYTREIKQNNAMDKTNYQNFIATLQAGGCEDFKLVFETITKLAQGMNGLEELSVIFFTDGCDTTNTK